MPIGASAERLGGGRKWDGSGAEGGRRERAMVAGVRSFSYSCSAGRTLPECGGRNPRLAERGRADMRGEDDGAETGSLSKGGQRGETRGGGGRRRTWMRRYLTCAQFRHQFATR